MKKGLFIIGILIAFSNLIQAQDGDKSLLNKLVEKNVLTQSEADEIKSESKPSITFDKVRNAFNTPYMQFGGNGQLMYRYSDVDKIHHDFKPKNVFISVSGKLNDSFRYGFLLEFVNPSVQEFWGEWTAAKEFNFKVGQFKVPVTLEGLLVPSNLETVAYSRTISNLFGFAGADDALLKQNGKNNFGRDAGVQISGQLLKIEKHDLLQYTLGMFQGMGVNSGEKNNSKDFAGTLMFQPVKGFRIGGGAYFGRASYQQVGETVSSEHVRNRWIVSADYKSERFNARAEWIHANDGGIDKEGLYGLAGYYIVPKKMEALAKVDYYNANKNVNKEAIDYTLGINYYIYNQCRIQLNYTYSDYKTNWGAKDSNIMLAQLQIGF